MFVALSVITFLPGILLVTKEPSDLEELLILNMSLLFTVCCQIFAYNHSVLCYVWCNLYIFQTATWLHWICIVIVEYIVGCDNDDDDDGDDVVI